MQYYKQFKEYFLNNDKDSCLNYIEELKNSKKINTIYLYEKLILPLLYEVGELVNNNKLAVWQEHAYSSIITCIIHNNYNQVLKEAKPRNNKVVLVVCPEGELHEIGALMANDYFILCGYNTIYIGANTPFDDIRTMLKELKPNIIAISISTPYNVISFKKPIIDLSEEFKEIKFVIGGNSANKNSKAFGDNKFYFASDYQSIVKLKEQL